MSSLQLRAGIDFHLADDAELVLSPRRSDYAGFGIAPYGGQYSTVITAAAAHGLRITGTGRIRGRSAAFVDHYDPAEGWWRPKDWRPRIFALTASKDVEVSGITIEDTPEWVLHLLGCDGVLVDGLTIRNNMEIPNSDGIDPDHCRDVEIRNCRIACGDDAISVKTTVQQRDYGPCANVRVSGSKDCRVAWGRNCPSSFTHALEAEEVSNLELTRFAGEAAHPERDEAVVISRSS